MQCFPVDVGGEENGYPSYQETPCHRHAAEGPAPSLPETQCALLLVPSLQQNFNTAQNSGKTENKNENKAKLRTTAHTSTTPGKKLNSLRLLPGLPLKVLLEAASDNCFLQLLLALQISDERPKLFLNSNCRIFQCCRMPLATHLSLPAWVVNRQWQIHNNSRPQAEGTEGLIPGEIPRYHKPAAVSLYSTFLSLIAYATTKTQAIKPKPTVNTETCLHF